MESKGITVRNNYWQTNDLIAKKLQTGDPFSLIRIDNTAGYVMECLSRGQRPLQEHYNRNTLIECGVYPTIEEYGFSIVYKLVQQAMDSCDILGFVDVSDTLSRSVFAKQYISKPTFFAEDCTVLDPIVLMGYHEKYGKVKNPWTKYLAGKKVLIISTHAESIKHQWQHMDKIWTDNRQDIAPFQLVDVIRSPYHPAIDTRQYPNCNSWLDSVNIIKNIMDTYDYDVLLSGATTSSPLYVEHAKSQGKIGIQVGGAIQLFFGIIGYRWALPAFAQWHRSFNENWIYPLEIDEPQRRKEFQFLESMYAYWRTTQ